MATAKKNPPTYQEMILALQSFWAQRGCVMQQPYDLEVGGFFFAVAINSASLYVLRSTLFALRLSPYAKQPTFNRSRVKRIA